MARDEAVALPFDRRVRVVDGRPVFGKPLEIVLEAGARICRSRAERPEEWYGISTAWPALRFGILW
jgi:hypothetical protein